MVIVRRPSRPPLPLSAREPRVAPPHHPPKRRPPPRETPATAAPEPAKKPADVKKPPEAKKPAEGANTKTVEEIIARVNNEIITRSELDKARIAAEEDARQECQGKCTPEQLRADI